MDTLIIASNNEGKLQEFKKLFIDLPIDVIGQPNTLKVKETGANFFENAKLKAIAAASYTGKLSLADDSGLCVKYLNGAPGIYSSRYAKTDKERVVKLLNELENVDDRDAYFSVALCLADPAGKVLLKEEGRCYGYIANSPRGIFGFGYDPIFEVKGTGLTFAEMESEYKRKFSHRGRAIEKLVPGIKRIFNI